MEPLTPPGDGPQPTDPYHPTSGWEGAHWPLPGAGGAVCSSLFPRHSTQATGWVHIHQACYCQPFMTLKNLPGTFAVWPENGTARLSWTPFLQLNQGQMALLGSKCNVVLLPQGPRVTLLLSASGRASAAPRASGDRNRTKP